MPIRLPETVRIAAAILLAVTLPAPSLRGADFEVTEASTAKIQAAYKSGKLTAHQLVQSYLDRIEAYNKKGPQINCVIAVNPAALKDAVGLDAQFKTSGLTGPLHGIPVLVKDHVDAAGMSTTLGPL